MSKINVPSSPQSSGFAHYTSQKGLLGIFGGMTIRATNIRYLNDEQEFNHALEVVQEIISCAAVPAQSGMAEVFKEFSLRVRESVMQLSDKHASDVFTVSFSKNADLLSQWRGYCPSSSGFSITFDLDALIDANRDRFKQIYLAECVYDIVEKGDRLANLLSEAWLDYHHSTETERVRLLAKLSLDIVLLASYFKHDSFVEENETRIVLVRSSYEDENVLYREGRSFLVPYMELSLPLESPRLITVGPCPDQRQSIDSVKGYLQSIYHPVSSESVFMPAVVASNIPFRDW